MSHLKARINQGGVVKVVELDRRTPSFATLRTQIQKKFKLQNADGLSFQIPSGPRIAVKSDDDLKRAIAESVKVRAKFLEFDLPGGPKGGAQSYSAPAQQAKASPASPAQHSQPAKQQQQAPAQQHPAKAPEPSGGGAVVKSFNLPGTGSSEKVKINPQPEETRYVFSPTLASLPTLVEIEIPSARVLQFRMTSSTSRFTQSFNLPFDITARDLSYQGNNVILTFPNF
eukprot:TRINITY_DN26753_c0_g1_i1.p1 TRINITY_DN26753_c0_g1~~TRINITY_DN26753_c0_g1_i1.p1  ORF type:complete len:228 (-),score=39.77 TRINITY_DN26753_c0_g1_i1:36-719(-)